MKCRPISEARDLERRDQFERKGALGEQVKKEECVKGGNWLQNAGSMISKALVLAKEGLHRLTLELLLTISPGRSAKPPVSSSCVASMKLISFS